MEEIDIIYGLIALVLLLGLFTILGLVAYSGAFFTPEVRSSDPFVGKCRIAYKFYRGGYDSPDIGALFTESISISPQSRGIGIFFDNPDEIPEHKQRCAIGCVIEDKSCDFSIDKDTETLFQEKEFLFFNLPIVQNAVTATFPYTTPFSIWLAPNRVYPMLMDYISSRHLCAYPIIELYTHSEIQYMVPLSKQDEFFVPEANINESDGNSTDDSDENSELYGSEKSSSKSKSRETSSSTVLEDSPPALRRRRGENQSASLIGQKEIKKEMTNERSSLETPINERSAAGKVAPIVVVPTENTPSKSEEENSEGTGSSFEDIVKDEKIRL